MAKESAVEKPATFTDGQKAYLTEQRVLIIIVRQASCGN
jgi:hypothetical protein